MDKLLYRPKEACTVLGIGRDKLYDLIRSGRLESLKDGGARLITADALRAYVTLLRSESEAALCLAASATVKERFPVRVKMGAMSAPFTLRQTRGR